MRFLILAFVIGATFAHSEVERKIVKRAIEDAEQWYNVVTLNNTLTAGYAKRRGTKMTAFSEEMEKNSSIYEKATEILAEIHDMGFGEALGLMTRQGTSPPACGRPTPTCQNSQIRTIDGSCNNLKNNPLWGAANTPLTRIVTSSYEDRTSEPRGGMPATRKPSRLPNPRIVSTTVHTSENRIDPSITNAVPVFGQFLDHDISMTPEGNLMCCRNPNQPGCGLQIPIPANDQFHNGVRSGQNCLDFTRSIGCFGTKSGVREQINTNTAFIDGSQIYGSTTTRARDLRKPKGLLKARSAVPMGFLPMPSDVTRDTIQGSFVAGDDRINENPALTTMHNLFLREHNRIATEINRVTKNSWSDEDVYQLTRKIVGAELAFITYGEYLPVLLGQGMSKNNLWVNRPSTYDPDINPSVINSFATAAYRFGHSLVNGVFQMFDVNGAPAGAFTIRDSFFNPSALLQSNGKGFDLIMMGMMRANAQAFDRLVTGDLTNFLFRAQGANFGSDLIARNIQRGRDHGLPPWNTFRKLCGLPPVTSFGSPPPNVDGSGLSRLSGLYRSPEDIDLFTGGLLEFPSVGGIIGETFQCIIGEQARRLKFGDRLFFTHQTSGFTSSQVAEISKRTLGAIMCDNGMLQSSSRNVFLVQSRNNPAISCQDPSRYLILEKFLK